ncbi:Scytalone dehydratase, partial [Lipomyces tetrasporus]
MGCEAALFEWAERLRSHYFGSNLLQIDYRSFLDKLWEDMPVEQFIAMASGPQFLGNPLIKTQHFVGLSLWEKTSESEVVGRHQVRGPHQKYTDESRTTVAVKGHSYGGAM